MPNSRFALDGLAPPEFTVCAPFFASNSRCMRLFQAALDTPLDSPFSATLSVHGLHFTVYAPSSNSFCSIMPPLPAVVAGLVAGPVVVAAAPDGVAESMLILHVNLADSSVAKPVLFLVDVSDIFFFSARRRGRGSPG